MPSASLRLILTELNKLNTYEVKQLYNVVEDKAVNLASITSISSQVKETKFSKGIICPHCESAHTVRNDQVKGNHTKSGVFTMPRLARKRGVSSKYRGISS
jgi:hypothetical protein